MPDHKLKLSYRKHIDFGKSWNSFHKILKHVVLPARLVHPLGNTGHYVLMFVYIFPWPSHAFRERELKIHPYPGVY